MKSRTLLVALALVGSACSSSDGKGSGGPGGVGAACNTETEAFECEIVRLVNEHRAAGADCGGQAYGAVPALTMNVQLRQAARAHGEDMAQNNYFSHDSQDGRSPRDRISAAGYDGRTWGENIAAGSSTPAGTMDQWMNSPGHCSNIMNPSFTEIGVGYSNGPGSTYRHYWVQVFGAPR